MCAQRSSLEFVDFLHRYSNGERRDSAPLAGLRAGDTPGIGSLDEAARDRQLSVIRAHRISGTHNADEGSHMEMLSQQQVAQTMGVSVSTVERLRRDRKISWLRIRGQIRITRDELGRYIKSAARDAGAAE